MNKLLSSSPLWYTAGLTLIRCFIGIFLIIHGSEIFDAEKMKGYIGWDIFKTSSTLPYIGKAAELIAGILLLLGLFTRLACLIIIGTFIYITFFVGKGKFWMDDQHPFLFVMLASVFFFTGAGKISLDNRLFRSS